MPVCYWDDKLSLEKPHSFCSSAAWRASLWRKRWPPWDTGKRRRRRGKCSRSSWCFYGQGTSSRSGCGRTPVWSHCRHCRRTREGNVTTFLTISTCSLFWTHVFGVTFIFLRWQKNGMVIKLSLQGLVAWMFTGFTDPIFSHSSQRCL